MASEHEETTPTERARALQMRFSGATPTLMREYGIRDFRTGRPRLSSDTDYRRGYKLGRRLSQNFPRFVATIERGVPGAQVGRECMAFLMRLQYGKKPPNPCPCYHWN